MIEEKHWYVVVTRPRWEKKVASFLLERGVEHYCPLNRMTRQWSDRRKIVWEPLFKGYVFVKLTDAFKWDIKTVNGVVNFVYWLGKPARVKEEEIDTIRKFLNEFNAVEVAEKELSKNTTVLVKQGLLMNYRGIVLEVRGSRAVVSIDSMGLELSAVFDKKNLQPV